MALSGQLYHPNDPTLAGALLLESTTTPPFTLPYDLSSTPLMLPRDWPDSYYYPDTHYDFQSNHLETGAEIDADVIPSLAGLGIKNIELCDVDLSAFGDDFQHSDTSERRDAQRVYRTESIYDVERNLDDPQNYHAHFPASTGSPWSLGSFLRAAELDPTAMPPEPTFIDTVALELDLSALSADTSDSSDDNLALSFEKLSAATGLSVAEFAAKISATAEETLKRMAEGDGMPMAPPVDPETAKALKQEVSTWPPLGNGTPEPILPVADINMRVSDSSWNAGGLGVNPADILPISPALPPLPDAGEVFEHIFPGEPVHMFNHQAQNVPLHIPDFHFDLQFPSLSHNLPSPGMQERFILPVPAAVHPPAEYTYEQDSRAGPVSDDERSLFQSPSCSEYSPPLPSTGTKRTQSSRISTRRTASYTQARVADEASTGYDYADTDMLLDAEQQQQNLPPINLGTPVFDAHRGIVLEELKAKAERYRLRNQGRDYDKRWLISFAGKLSHRGELLEEFRCYVAGCKQVNKRRDHILIHVGAHLDQRPFKCMHCSSRFLRKNECKRHELSHTGVRPFSCHLCPSPATTFVRQDLLKRHMKRTHRIDFKIDKENDEPLRPRKRAKH